MTKAKWIDLACFLVLMTSIISFFVTVSDGYEYAWLFWLPITTSALTLVRND